MDIASRMLIDPAGAMETLAGLIPKPLRAPIGRDLGENMVLAAQITAGQGNAELIKQAASLARGMIEPLHMEPWALEFKKRMGMEADDYLSFVTMLYSVVGASTLKALEAE